jgi:hypothetical protein
MAAVSAICDLITWAAKLILGALVGAIVVITLARCGGAMD